MANQVDVNFERVSTPELKGFRMTVAGSKGETSILLPDEKMVGLMGWVNTCLEIEKAHAVEPPCDVEVGDGC